jgi:hypothetical protein
MHDATQTNVYTGPEALYAKSKEHRRVLVLELMAWTITQAEQCDPAIEAAEHRARTWGDRPWSGAPNADDFIKHVTDMARVFTEAEGAGDAWYPNRKIGPPAGMDV